MNTTAIGNAAVVTRSIVWGDGLTDRERRDALESLLFAQAAADKQRKPTDEDEALAWYNVFTHTLGSIGWTVQQYRFTELESNEMQGSIKDTVLTSFENDEDVDKTLLASVARGLLAFARAGKDSDADRVFNDASIASPNFVSFQLVVVTVDQGEVIITLWAFFYSSEEEEIDDALWFSWKNTKVSIKTAKIVMTLNRGLYDQVRDLIHQKLNDANKLHLLVPLLAQERIDVCESLLLAETAADQEFTPATEDWAWYEAYIHTLSELVWAVQLDWWAIRSAFAFESARGMINLAVMTVSLGRRPTKRRDLCTAVVLTLLANDEGADKSPHMSIPSGSQAFAITGRDFAAKKMFNVASIVSSTIVYFQLAAVM
ncbi:hypothetical protein ONZ51_g8893 [Trametes cubensis]|uniref:Uncharacterized protein n=1 Tax=Trametes cubensis TaxID=1111947 RepID=A0AAD7TMF5_9APHY|nr:hypothetical protein ONZ51_g8893 [Trametes cubensis]